MEAKLKAAEVRHNDLPSIVFPARLQLYAVYFV